MQRDRHSDQEQENSLRMKQKKELKTKPLKKTIQSRSITSYFSKIQKQEPMMNKNIPTPNKQAIEEMDQKIHNLQAQQHDLRQKIEQINNRCERQKETYQTYMTKSRTMVANQLKKIAQINSFFRRQKVSQLITKQIQLNALKLKIQKHQILLTEPRVHASQIYFIKKELQIDIINSRILASQIDIQTQMLRLSNEQQCSFFSKMGWPLLSKRYQPLSLLGKGGFSEVYQAYDLENNQYMALKVSSVEHLLMNCANRHQYLKHIKRQYEIHKQLCHPHIVKLNDVIQLEAGICLALQYCQGKTLAEYLKKQGRLCESEAKIIVRQILEVIYYLSIQNPVVIHYDLKPQNIMFDKGLIKVLDFGICKIMDTDHSKMALTSQGMGSYWYLPPETFTNHNPTVSSKVDIWSVGVIFYELLYGKRPFGQNLTSNGFLMQGVNITAKQISFPSEIQVSQKCKDFIRKFLQADQRHRIDPSTALNHPYFKEFQ